ncbi:uncharacterized protein LOC121726435 [Aricia agestis]|uniref:uncharacterized protein LOC121726435 n=1 Tax=Aricia agestis TaxID=91739 RepID=UPI001C205483|nr:uncharacterized protein LOC121726435 [Aricia agestis]
MSEKLKEYQVLDVFSGGTFYKVRHKVTNNIFAWKAFNCSAYSDEKIQNAVNEVKTISKLLPGSFLRYFDTILHDPTKTLYVVLEYISWQSVQDLITVCKSTDKYFNENFIWYLLLNVARACKIVENNNFIALRKCLRAESIFVDHDCDVRINGFELCLEENGAESLMHQLGALLHTICYLPGACDDKIKQFRYSTDLVDVISFLRDEKNIGIKSDVIIYHPTVLANTDGNSRPTSFSDILLSADYKDSSFEANKCDSEKAVELCNRIEPMPRLSIFDSPIYCNVISKKAYEEDIEESKSERNSLSPTIAALALELPGFVPRSRKPISQALCHYEGPKQISEETLSHQWMARMIALRQREESLNQRERELIAKEIVNSPTTKLVPHNDSLEEECFSSNGITLPEVITRASEVQNNWVSRRRQRKSSSVRPKGRRKSYAYEDLDSSLSADTGDSSMIITATKFTKDNMPRRNIFPETSTKKVHFTSTNPFAESDDSVTLTFYELENNVEEKTLPKSTDCRDINKFKYLDTEKINSEKRSAKNWAHSSPSKQAKISGKAFTDITNRKNMRKTPSKSSLTSKTSKTSCPSEWSIDSGRASGISNQSGGSLASKQALAQTPKAPPEFKKTKTRKSLLPFKTPFKFRSTSTKV